MKSKILAIFLLTSAAKLAWAVAPDVPGAPAAAVTGMRSMPLALAQWTAPEVGSSSVLASLMAGAGLLGVLARRRLSK